MPIDRIRISAFFTTHLTTDQPSICNTLTNIAFAPIQQLIGQKKYQCLKGRVYELTSAPQPSSSQLNSAWKVIVVITAIFLTPCGILTRYLSFRSSDITLGYWSALLLPLSLVQRSGFLTGVNSNLQPKIHAQLDALKKQQILDPHITSAITFLEKLEGQLFGPDALKAKEWLDVASNKPDYPYPFQLAEELKNNRLRDIPKRQLLEKFEVLHWNCCRLLNLNNPSEMKAASQNPIRLQLAVLNQNNQFFTELLNKTENLDLSTEDIVAWLEKEKKSPNYSYPFYAQRLLLPNLKQITSSPNDLVPFEKTYTDCIQVMNQNAPLKPFTTEEPPADHPMILQIHLAMKQLTNIRRIEALYNLYK